MLLNLHRPITIALSAAHSTHPICRVCKQAFDPRSNTEKSCRYHPAIYTGGEVGKATGFVRKSSAPEHQLKSVLGTGLIRFWDCCGKADPDAEGCEVGRHLSFDE